METNTFNETAYVNATQVFPQITYEEFENIKNIQVRKDIVGANRILQTDAYNRTMAHMRWEKGIQEETFTLTFRKSPNNSFNVIHWVRNTLQTLFQHPITQSELDFAKAAIQTVNKSKWVSYFNEQMRQDIIDNNSGYIPLTITSVEDWTVLKPQEPLMRVTWPGEIAAHFEPCLIPIFYQSVVATDAAYLDEIISDWRMIEVGKRGAVNEAMHIDALESLYIWWWLTHTSNDAATVIYPQLTSVWTIWHRYLSSYASENEAFRNAIETADKASLLVDMADSYSGIEKSIELKKEYRDNPEKIVSMRLDSGDLIKQAIYALTLQKEAWLTDPTRDKIIIEGIESIDEFRKIDKEIEDAWFNPKRWIIFWSWEILIAKNKVRSAVSAGFKLTNTILWPTWKISNSPWKEPIPGKPNIEIREDERVIVQEDEAVNWKRLLTKVYENWLFYYWQTDELMYLDDTRKRVKQSMKEILLPSVKSERTIEVHKNVRKMLLSNIQQPAA